MSRLITLLAVAIMACAQQPYFTLPQNYTLAFENESVRISRVKYSPGDKLPVHSHPSIPTVYVYLTDGGPIRFIHKTPKVTIVRAEVKAGQVRFNRNARVETHPLPHARGSARSPERQRAGSPRRRITRSETWPLSLLQKQQEAPDLDGRSDIAVERDLPLV